MQEYKKKSEENDYMKDARKYESESKKTKLLFLEMKIEVKKTIAK